VWVLHERHITDFDGNFAEWETVSAERQHAASVRAAEDEALRRVQEKKKTARREDSTRDTRNALRTAKRRVAELETAIQSSEARIGELTAALEDPALYTRTDGVTQAAHLGADLDETRRALERALEEWAVATEAVEALAGTP
jgi:ATPase subunit of ABC transporter with duplicated ATPase domains